MGSEADTLKILIDVQGRLDDLVKAQSEMRRLRIETAATGQAVRSGFSGLFSNIFGAGLAVNAVSRAVSTGLNLITGSVRDANETFEKSRNLDVGLQGYMKVSSVIRQSGGDVRALDQAIDGLNNHIAEALAGTPVSEGLFRSLHLDPLELEALPSEERIVRVGRAARYASDEMAAWKTVGDIIGTKTLRNIRAGLTELAENGFDSVSSSATEAEARGTSAIHALFDSLEQSKAVFSSKVVEDFGGMLGGLGFSTEVPKDRQITREDMGKLKTIQQQRDALKALQLDISTLQKETESYTNDPSYTDSQKKFFANDAASKTLHLIDLLKTLRASMPLDLKKQSAEERAAELAGYEYAIKGIETSLKTPPSKYRQISEQFDNLNVAPNANGGGNPNFLTAGQGAGAGAMEWANSLGSTGEQVASMMQNSIGEAVRSISDGIYGWITGANDFSSVLVSLGGSVLHSLIDSIVQMGVQWIITGGLAKATLAGIHALGSMLRSKETVEVIASETAKKPALVSNAAAANAGSFGMSAVIGLAILVALLAAFGGFESGGYTGNVPTNMVAGVVHGQEGVLNASAMRRLGVNNLDRMNAGMPLSPSTSMAFEGQGPAAAAGGRESARNTHIYLDRSAWLDAVRQDLGGIAHEVYDKRARS